MNAVPIPFRLHGHPVSNYFNAVHAALIEKNAAFEIVHGGASQDEAFLARSPMGKIPYLETPQGCIAETVAILEYLEDEIPHLPLFPSDHFARARARQMINVVQMYVEAPVRSIFPGVFFGGTNGAETQANVRLTLDRATGALRRLANPAPWLLGDAFGAADIFAFYCLDIAERVTRFVYDRSILAETGLLDWHAAMVARDSSRTVLANFGPAFAAYLLDKNAAYTPERELHHA
jgi:glutathione S-transferase